MNAPIAKPRGKSLVWRILHFPPMTLIVAIGVMLGASVVATSLAAVVGARSDSHWAIVGGSLVAAVFMIAYIGFGRLVEHRRMTDLALKGALVELLIGLAIGTVLFCAVVGVIALLGGYRVVGTQPADVLYPIIGLSIVSGVTEEIMLRGLFFRIIEGWLGSWVALVLSAALFGALHLGNPNATLVAGGAIAIEAGVMLAAIYMVTRRLWAAIGLHAAWNFTQGGIFGIPVSGTDVQGVLVPRISGPILLTGGDFGAEASLPAMLICTAFGIALLVIASRRGQVIKPYWARGAADGVGVGADADAGDALSAGAGAQS
ncbi:CPBP family intramembrane glutamic endopeptidase [Sphingomonas sp. 28-63-12]|uniref:CPBP family intramembrane glutamic endopeptidase n=1 Tax=Sphingomonas sp. 28-63-12 TaxID=1970434 RepID=UPI000BCAAF7B|nr:MAG: CPBP family intramembrane metalloprotease [Sphingomonas sp. 28-63-12]